jgi:hypothetical protein
LSVLHGGEWALLVKCVDVLAPTQTVCPKMAGFLLGDVMQASNQWAQTERVGFLGVSGQFMPLSTSMLTSYCSLSIESIHI